VWPAQQQQEQQQQQEEEEEEQQQQVPHASAEPPAGPTLQQLQQLLAAAAVPTCTSPDTPTAPGNSNHGSLAIGGSSSDANTTGGRQGPTDNSDTTSGDRADAGPLLIPCWDPLQGRHLVAGRSCGPGQVLLQEVPLAVLPMKPVRGNRCWCCLGPLGSAPHPCPGCPLVRPPGSSQDACVITCIAAYTQQLINSDATKVCLMTGQLLALAVSSFGAEAPVCMRHHEGSLHEG
jgi:hypothetical protein